MHLNVTKKSAPLRVVVIGLGYVGLPTAATLAAKGVSVLGVDINERVVDAVNTGTSHILETDLDVILSAAVGSGLLKAALEPSEADVFLIAVPTPITDAKLADLRAVESAFLSIAPHLKAGDLILLESTSPVGTTRRMAELAASLRPDLSFPQNRPESSDVMVAYCPERILPGRTLLELVENSRTIGGLDMRSAERAMLFYEIFCKGELFLTNAQTAELTKLTENSFRDVNIAFANELSMLCEGFDVDVYDLIEAANRHPRVNILLPGPGVGGHCIPIDPWFIVEAQPETARLIHTARQVNDRKAHYVLSQIRSALTGPETSVAILGLAYKPDVDDLRESPAVEIGAELARHHQGPVLIVEPHIDVLPKAFEGTRAELVSLDEALGRASVVATLVAHTVFKRSDELKRRIGINVIDAVGLSDLDGR